MMSKEELCKKITDLYPEIGICGINLNVSYSKEKKAWVVDLKKGSHELQHYLEDLRMPRPAWKANNVCPWDSRLPSCEKILRGSSIDFLWEVKARKSCATSPQEISGAKRTKSCRIGHGMRG